MKKILTILCLSIILLFIQVSLARATPINISNNDRSDYYPQINNNNWVTWRGWDGHDWEIYLWDGSTVKNISNNDGADYYPQINNNNWVTWRGWDGHDREIYLWDGSTVKNISNNDSIDDNPQINDNNYVTWQGIIPLIGDEIFLYNGSTTYTINGVYSNNKDPQINNNNWVTWEGTLGTGAEILLYNGSSIQRLTNDFGIKDEKPQINDNNRVTWIRYDTLDGSDTEIYYWNGSTIQPLSNTFYPSETPQINDNNRVTWRGWWDHDTFSAYEICLWNGSTTTNITSHPFSEYNPQINNNNYLTWQGWDGIDDEIYLWNGSITRSLTNNDYKDEKPQINNNYVAWRGNEGIASEIFIDKFSDVTSPRAYLPNITKNYLGWTTPLAVQNLGGVNSKIEVKFYNKTGTNVLTKSFTGVSPNSQVSVNPAAESALGSTFQGSAVVYSDEPVASVVNEHSSNCSMAYEGISPYSSTTKAYLPNITRNYHGWTTPFVVQNLDSSVANVTVDFYRKGSTTSSRTIDLSVNPGASQGVNPGTYSSLGTFQGSVVIDANKKIGSIVNEHYVTEQAMSYNSFDRGGRTVYLPNVTRNYSGWTTPFAIQNLGTSSTNATVRFYRKGVTTPALTLTTPSIPAGGNQTVNPGTYSSLGTFQGSVEIEASGATHRIVAVVNEHSSSDSMAYSGVSVGKNKFSQPNITRSYFGWDTPFAIQNLGTSSTNATVRFYRKGVTTPALTLTTPSIPAGGSQTVNPGTYSFLGTFQGSVSITSSGQVAAIVNEHHTNGQAMSYNGF